jgi:hypothetical protein
MLILITINTIIAIASASWAGEPGVVFPPQKQGLKVLVGDGWDMGDFASQGSKLYSFMGDCGIYLTRVGASWGQVEERKGEYNWWETDSQVAFWHPRGVEFHFTMIGSPKWARFTHPTDNEAAQNSGLPYIELDLPKLEYLKDLSAWAESLAARYKGKVRYFEWWNEPDGIPGPVPLRNKEGQIIGGRVGGDPVRYALTLKAVHDGLKRGNPEAKLAAGSLSVSTPDSNLPGIPTDGGFIEAVYATVGKDAFEAITYHPYSDEGLDTKWTESLRAICVRYGDLDCELWANEYSWNYKTRDKLTTIYGIGPGAETLPQDGITLAAQYPYITQIYLHTLNDWSGAGQTENDPNSGFGILDMKLNPKPKYQQYKESLNWRRDSLSREQCIIGPHVVFAGSVFVLEFEEHVAPHLLNVKWYVPPGWSVTRIKNNRTYAFRCPANAASPKPYPLTATREDGRSFTHYVEVVEPVQLTWAITRRGADNVSPAKVEMLVRNLTSQPMTVAPAFDLPQGWTFTDKSVRTLKPKEVTKWLVDVKADVSVKPGTYLTKAYVSIGGRKACVYYFMLKKSAPAKLAKSPIKIDGELSDWLNEIWQEVPGSIQAKFSTSWDNNNFYLACVVNDDHHVQTQSPKHFPNEDCLQFAFDTACDAVPGSVYTWNDYEYQTALTSEGKWAIYRSHAPPDSYGGELDSIDVKITRKSDQTIYEIAIPWSEMKPAKPKVGAELGMSLVVNDKDTGDRVRASWGHGFIGAKRPIYFGRVRLVQ